MGFTCGRSAPSGAKIPDLPPPGFDVGEQGQFRQVRAKTIKFAVGQDRPQALIPEQVEQLLAARMRSRDRFLIGLLICTGIRIGEALGMRREDMHLLAQSLDLGCPAVGPHVHVRRRLNANGALANLHSRVLCQSPTMSWPYTPTTNTIDMTGALTTPTWSSSTCTGLRWAAR